MLRRFHRWKVVGNIGLHFARSFLQLKVNLGHSVLALGTKLYRTNLDCGKFLPLKTEGCELANQN